MSTKHDKISISTNTLNLINQIVSDVEDLAQAVSEATQGNYTQAVQDSLQLILHILQQFVLPKVKVSLQSYVQDGMMTEDQAKELADFPTHQEWLKTQKKEVK